MIVAVSEVETANAHLIGVRDGHFPAPRPFVPGFEASGQIIAAGEGVDPARVGEQVIALTSSGAFAEVVVVSSVLAIAAPTVDSRTAAAFGWVTSTAYDLINTVAVTSPQAFSLGARILRNVPVDWPAVGVTTDEDLDGLAEILMRLFISFLQFPSTPALIDDRLRALIRRWIGPALRE